jgi:hypothetical protein
MEGVGFLYYNYYYCRNHKKGIFLGIAIGLLILLLFDTSLKEFSILQNDEFIGDDEDDCK